MGRVPGFVKWVVSPALAALLGYGVIGPRLAGHTRMVEAVQEQMSRVVPLVGHETPTAERPPAEEPSEERTKPVPPPEVSVTAKPADEAPRPRRRGRHGSAATDEAPPETTPNRDRDGPDPASTP